MPRRPSMLTVNAVCRGERLSAAIIGSPSCGDPLLGQRQADEAAPLARHEVDRLGRDQIGGHRQVALVLAILVVDEDHHPAGADRVDGARDRRVAFCRSADKAVPPQRVDRDLAARGVARALRESPPSCAATSRSMCLTIMSASRFTVSPTRLSPSLVTSSVCGISVTENTVPHDSVDRQADAVDRDRALGRQEARQLRRRRDLELERRARCAARRRPSP